MADSKNTVVIAIENDLFTVAIYTDDVSIEPEMQFTRHQEQGVVYWECEHGDDLYRLGSSARLTTMLGEAEMVIDLEKLYAGSSTFLEMGG